MLSLIWWFACAWAISRVDPVVLDPLCTAGASWRDCGSQNLSTPIESLTLSTQCGGDGCPLLGALNVGRARGLESAQAWDSTTSNVTIAMTWNTEYTCPEGYFLVAFRTTENPKLLTDILELHCNRPTNLFTSYSSTVKVTANPWTQGAKMEFSCPASSYVIGFAVRSADLGGSKQDVSDLTLICAYPLNSECSTNSLLSTNTTVSAPCNYQYCVANVSCLPGFRSVSGSQFVECTTNGWNTTALQCVAADACMNPNSCPANSNCTNLLGDFRCDCNPGYLMNGQGTCSNVDECKSPCLIGEADPLMAQCNDCSTTERCVDLPGSFQCVNATVNECQTACTGNVTTNCHNCSQFANCTDTATSFFCTCPSGFTTGNAGVVCDDVNECASSPCGTHSTCLNMNGSYTCSCDSGFTNISGVCSNVNECPAACTGLGTCVDTAGSFFCMPTVLAMQLNSNPAPFTLASTRQSPADTVRVTLRKGLNCVRDSNLYYGSTNIPQDFSTNSCSSVSSNATTEVLDCQMNAGAGGNLTMSVRCCLGSVCSFSSTPSLLFSYPKPTITPLTLTYLGSPDPLGIARINVNQTSATLTMQGTNFFPLETAISFGPSRYPCTPLNVTSTQIVCVPPPGAFGTNLTFTVTVGAGGSEQAVTGVDLLSFTGDPPFVTNITGCVPKGAGIGIMDCPTFGGSLLVVTGKTLSNANLTNPRLMIGGQPCSPAGAFVAPSFSCTLPAGTGVDLTVEIRDVSGSSFANIISYGKPRITTISSPLCTSITNLTLVNCSDSFALSILGDNFGDSGAVVQINTVVLPARHVDYFSGEPATPNGKHRHLTVDVPSSITTVNQVYVLQRNGIQSSDNASFSLSPCASGFGRNTTSSCVQCITGRMATSEVCVDCPLGYFQSQPGQSACNRCPAGQAQSSYGQTSCVQCGLGTYSLGFGNTVCASCIAGRYAAGATNTACLSCAPGSMSGLNAGVCTNCTAGYFSLGNTATCQECSPGRVSGSASSSCAPCSFGTFKSDVGASVCSLCPAGSFSEALGSSFCVQCEPGTAQSTPRTSCSACSPGSYQSRPGMIACLGCPPGQFSDVAGSTACQVCDAGRYSTGNASTCTSCLVGYAQPLSGSSNCSQCKPGSYSSLVGTRVCDACAAGYYQSLPGTSGCEYCLAGGYAPAQGSTACLKCSPGYFQPAVGQQRCLPCAAGTASGVAGASSCVDCLPGSAASQSASISCDLCLPGQYNDQMNAVICLSCPPGHIASRSGSVSCPKCPSVAIPNEVATGCLCGLGQYTENYNGTLECLTCPRGSFCGVLGLTAEDLVSLTGWWRTDNTSLEFYRCKNPHFCLANDKCVEFREGPMCALCIPGYRSGGPTKDCAACPTKGAAWGLSIVIILFLAVLLFVMYYIIIRMTNIQQARLMRLVDTGNKIALTNLNNKLAVDDNHFEAVRKEARAKSGADFEEDDFDYEVQEIKLKLTAADTSRRAPNFMYKVKILIGFFQIASFLPAQGDVSWPSAFTDFIEAFAIFNFDFIPWQTLGCAAAFDYFTKAVIVGLIPIIVVVVLVIVFVINTVISDRASLQDQMLKQQRREAIWRQFVRLVLFTVFLLYPFVSKITLGVYNCVTIRENSYLVADFTLPCYDDVWTSYAIGIGFFVALYPIGIPLAYFLIMRNVRHEMGEPGTIVMLGFLYEAYVTSAWYWELVDLLHKLILTSIVVFVSSQARMACNMAIITVYLMALLLVSPYVRKGDDRFHQLVQVNLYCLALCGHILNATDNPYNSTLASPDTLDKLLSALLICITIGLLVGFLIIAGRNVRKIYIARQQAKRKAAQATTSGTSNSTTESSTGIISTQANISTTAV